MPYAQLFCTAADMYADSLSGVDETRMYQAIREASDYLQKEIGWFIPVTLTRKFKASNPYRHLLPPLLAIDSITNDGEPLTGGDYILKPDAGYWLNGPYGEILPHPDSDALLSWSDDEDGIVISGRWGLYEKTIELSATVADTTQQGASQKTLKLSDGSKGSPGMILLVESEQELVTGWGAPTEGITQLNGSVSMTDDVITVTNAGAVNIGEVIRIDFEQCLVKDRRTNTNKLSLVRGWNGTSRVSHANAAAIDVYRTVNVERAVNGTTASTHANGIGVSRYVAPDDVQYLCKQIATLIVNKAKSGYQGRTGNEQTGVVFYHDAFPRFEIERIKTRYHIPRHP